MKMKDKLLKLYELSKRGIDGEKANAGAMLMKMLDKHNMTMDDIVEDVVKRRTYRYTSKLNENIISQIAYKVLNKDEVYICASTKEVVLYVTDYQHVQMLELIDFHLTKFNKERVQFLKDFTSAYIHKHKLFRDSVDDERSSPMTLKEKQSLMRVFGIYEMLDDETYIKKIAQ